MTRRPLRAARSALCGACTPYQTGGCGFWQRHKLHRHRVEVEKLPWNVSVGSVMPLMISSSASA